MLYEVITTDRASVVLRTLSAADKLDPALDILRSVLQAPRFDGAIFDREKARTIAGLKEAMTRPDSIAGKAFWEALYPKHVITSYSIHYTKLYDIPSN